METILECVDGEGKFSAPHIAEEICGTYHVEDDVRWFHNMVRMIYHPLVMAVRSCRTNEYVMCIM